jgi:hypothetical protein
MAVIAVNHTEFGANVASMPDEIVPAPDLILDSTEMDAAARKSGADLATLLADAIQRRATRTAMPQELSSVLATRGAQAVAFLARARELDRDVNRLHADLEFAREQIGARDRIINEQSSWIGELERGKNWLEGAWKRALDEAAEHLRAKNWLEEQLKTATDEAHSWKGRSRDVESVMRVFEESTWMRFGRRLGVMKGRQAGEPAASSGSAGDESRNKTS